MNLAQKAQSGDLDLEKKPFELFQGYTSDAASAQGLLGVLRNLTIEHNIDSKGAYIKASNTILPKLINISFDYDVIHEHALGWDEESNFSNEFFPYGVAMPDPFKKATQENPGMSFDQIIEKVEQDKRDAAKAQAELEAAQSKFRNIFTGAPSAQKAKNKLEKDAQRGDDHKKKFTQAERDYLESIAASGDTS
tara:strand:- start:199 stop:777 length:579 start_codon:yes stop_codon:yes gene_type:complete